MLFRLEDQLLVQGLDGGQVDDPCGDARLGQRVRSLHRLRHQQAVGQNRHVSALPERFALADPEHKPLLTGGLCLQLRHVCRRTGL